MEQVVADIEHLHDEQRCQFTRITQLQGEIDGLKRRRAKSPIAV